MSISKLTLFFFCVITSGFGQTPSPNPVRSIVYVAHDPDAIVNYRTNPRVVHGMVDRLVMAATGQSDVAKAWASLVSPEDKVGIKISAAGGELFTTAIGREVSYIEVAGQMGLGKTDATWIDVKNTGR